MRISDWSSDVCSSDLVAGEEAAVGEFGSDGRHFRLDLVDAAGEAVVVTLVLVAEFLALLWNRPAPGPSRKREGGFLHLRRGGPRALRLPVGIRSEEHTSELQSLMRISYAVFCLKKKKTQKT